jgi:hypothetical protein
MAWGNFLLDVGMDASGAISKYRLVKYTSAETVTAVTAIADDPIGVSQFGVTTGEIAKGKGASVRVHGVSEVEASGAIAVGQRCQLETDGRVKLAVAASGARLVGRCVGHPSTNAGDRISMLIIQGGPTL